MASEEFIRAVVEDFNKHERTSRESGKIWGIHSTTVLKYLNEKMPNETSRRILDENTLKSRFGGGFK